MEVVTDVFHISTRGNSEVVDITPEVEKRLQEHRMKDGIVTVFVVGSTACLTTTEYEPGLRKDIPAMLDRLVPQNDRYFHNTTWEDGNGHSHVRAALIGPSLTIPFTNGTLELGTWQQIVLIDCDTRGRTRKIVLQMIGTHQ